MKDLFTGLWTYTQTTSATSFRNGIGSRFFPEYAPEGTQFPYGVYSLDSNIHDWQFKSDYEEALITLHLFSDDDDGSEIMDLEKKARSAYDDANFTVANHTLLRFRFDNEWLTAHPDMIPNKIIWQYTIQYSVLLHKNT